MSASFGVISGTQLNHGDAEALIQAADESLYQAKASGRNCVQAAGRSSGLAGGACVAPPIVANDSAVIAERKQR